MIIWTVKIVFWLVLQCDTVAIILTACIQDTDINIIILYCDISNTISAFSGWSVTEKVFIILLIFNFAIARSLGIIPVFIKSILCAWFVESWKRRVFYLRLKGKVVNRLFVHSDYITAWPFAFK